MNTSKWYRFLREQQEEEELTIKVKDTDEVASDNTADNQISKELDIDPIVTDEISVFEIIVKAEFRKSTNVLLTQFKDIIRGIVSVTTVGTEDLPDPSMLYDRRNLNVKFELERGENIDEYMRAVLVPQLRKIRGMRILHYGKVEKVRQLTDQFHVYILAWVSYMSETKTKLKIPADRLAAAATIDALLKSQKKIKELYAYEMIMGEGYGHYYSPDEKTFVKIRKGRLITRLSEDTDKKGRYLIYAENQRVLVPKEEIIDIGYY